MDDSLGTFSLILLAMPGLALIVVARALFPPRPGHRPEMQQLLRMIGILLVLFALAGAALGVVGPLAVVGIPVIAVVVLMIVDRYRRGEHQSLLYTLAAGAQRGVPLNQSARAFAEENGGDTATRAAVLAESLEQGMPLREALRRARLKMSTATKLSVRLGESLGELGNVLLRSLDDTTEIDTALRGAMAQVFYLIALLFVGTVILLFVMLKIVPVFEKMFEEFELKLPAMTVALVNLSSWMSDFGLFFYIAGVVFLHTVPLLGALYFIGWLPADLPLLNLLARKYDKSLVLHGLAVCVHRRLSISDAIGVLSHEFPRSTTANRMRLVWVAVQHGVDWRLAMQQARLLSQSESAVLDAAQRSGNLAWALEEMADSSLRRYILWVQLRYQLAFPVVLLLLGGCVGYVVIALTLPLVALVQGLS